MRSTQDRGASTRSLVFFSHWRGDRFELRGGLALGFCAPPQREPPGDMVLLLAIRAAAQVVSGGAQAPDRARAWNAAHWQALRGFSNRCLRGLLHAPD